MDVLDTVAAVRGTLYGKGTIAFVPTMGNLHAGHIALMERARALADTVVSSVFVNRLQFGPNEDFDRYPRTFAADCEQMAAAGVDFVFAPGEADLYPSPQVFSVALPPIENELEGAVRPGHFRGVATVVLKLFNIVQPQIAVFGQKDYQQLMIIRQMVEQFALPIEIVVGPTVRADDGLALSSRNGYLSPAERAEAPRLNATLRHVRERLLTGETTDIGALEREAVATLNRHGWQADYVAVRRRSDLQSAPPDYAGPLVVLGAARIGSTRLIDNIEV
ncbi:MAG TPA: pantoate--beta-alanine ligase [Rhodocyclaceae bacterium]